MGLRRLESGQSGGTSPPDELCHDGCFRGSAVEPFVSVHDVLAQVVQKGNGEEQLAAPCAPLTSSPAEFILGWWFEHGGPFVQAGRIDLGRVGSALLVAPSDP